MILDCKFNETAWKYADGEYGWFGLWDMRAQAHDNGMSGFGLIAENGMGEPVDVWAERHSFYNCECQSMRVRANFEAIRDEFESNGCQWFEYRGRFAYDASDAKAVKIAAEFDGFAESYPILDEMRLSELESENAYEIINNCFSLPDDIDASDVLAEMNETPFCGSCDGVDIDDAMSKLDYVCCVKCGDWVKSYHQAESVCFDCAIEYDIEGCGCVSLYLHTAEHNQFAPTVSGIREVQRGCAHCYPHIYPYARAA